ncbi:hypothetical protein Tco_0652094 [Tanacetum coccineum]|uniref:Uncharacterized protein n=1 Tax=Tanacetum coccineum TaxID=301880 RepID=A0ABQ4WX84_9ASTR
MTPKRTTRSTPAATTTTTTTVTDAQLKALIDQGVANALVTEAEMAKTVMIQAREELIKASRLKKVMADKGKKSSMETFAPNDKADYYFGITSITFNLKNAYELKGKFLDDMHNNAFSRTNRKDAVEHIKDYLEIIDPINSLHYQDLEWYEALEDSELKDEALRNKAIMEGLISDDE